MAMTELETLKAEKRALERQLLVETIRRLSAEGQAATSALAMLQMRIPMIEQEMGLAKSKLAELTREEDGSSGH